MPIYRYICKTCGNEFDFLLMGKDDDAKCEICGSTDLDKVVSNCSFRLTGSGFHETDYKNQGK